MDNVMLVVRYVLFGLFIVCNAVVCSVAVWNLSLAQPLGWNIPVDIYLIFLGAFGLGFSFILMFVLLGVPNSFMGRVWFECTWVGLFFVMDLAGATAAVAILPDLMCNPDGILINLNHNPLLPGFGRQRVPQSCPSTRVLLAFTWMSSILLLVYFCFLTTSAFIHQTQDPKVWIRNVRSIQWSDTRRQLASAPPSPSVPRFLKKSNSTSAPGIVAPRPRHAIRPDIYAYRSGLSTEYEIEHYKPGTSPVPGPEIGDPPLMLAIPAAAAPPLLARNPSLQSSSEPSFATAFYPQYVQSTLPAHQQQPHPNPVVTLSHQQQPSSPPPLGDWPRTDAITRPLRTKRRPPPPLDRAGASSSSAPAFRPDPAALAAAASPTSHAISPLSPQSRSRPSGPLGPRTRSTSHGANRPPPLDLSNISSHTERRG